MVGVPRGQGLGSEGVRYSAPRKGLEESTKCSRLPRETEAALGWWLAQTLSILWAVY